MAEQKPLKRGTTGLEEFTSSDTLPAANLPATVLLNGGNTTGAGMAVGSNDSNAVVFETNNTTRMTLAATGGWQFNTVMTIDTSLIETFTTTGTASTSKSFILCNTAGGFTLTVTTASGRAYWITSRGGGNLVIDPSSGNIDGNATKTLRDTGTFIICDGTDWFSF